MINKTAISQSGKLVAFRPKTPTLPAQAARSPAAQTTALALCEIGCLAQAFDFPALQARLPASKCVQFHRSVITLEHASGWSMLYPFGTVVHWNVSAEERLKLRTLLLEAATNPLVQPLQEIYTYTLNCGHNRIQQDHIELQSGEPLLLLALSHIMAQSIKLAAFEAQALQTIADTRHLPQSLANQGKIKLGRTATARIRGRLFLAKSDIFLNYGLLDTPEFFWEHPEYEPIYTLAATYFEIRSRTEVLSKKLETIRELLEMLADEQKHQHSSVLEWIIIWLIVAEIAITVGEKLF